MVSASSASNKGIVSIFQELLQRLLDSCQEFYGSRLITVAIFGSAGREVPRADSDIDVFIIAASLPDGRIRRVEEFQGVEEKLKPALLGARSRGVYTYLSPFFKTSDEVLRGSPLFLDMLDDGKILYDRGGFFTAELEKLRERLAKLKARRIWKGNAWYWGLKPDFQPGEVFEI